VLNNPADMLGMVLRSTLGRSGRKRARRATNFLSGHKGFLSASTIMAAAGVAWGIYDTLQNQGASSLPSVPGVPAIPGSPTAIPPIPTFPTVPAAVAAAIDPLLRVVQLAVSAAKADGVLTDPERALILERAKQAGVEAIVEAELNQMRPLAEIVAGVSDDTTRNELYVLAFTIVRADEDVSGAERIYLAQLAYYLGLDVAAAQALEQQTAIKIDSQPEN
jgi:uncharacterized membrane protein YebE (DUF533 family)